MPDSWQQIDSDGYVMDWSSMATILLGDIIHPMRAAWRCLKEKIKASYLCWEDMGVSGTSHTYPWYLHRFAGGYFEAAEYIQPLHPLVGTALIMDAAKNTLIPLFLNHTADQTTIPPTGLTKWTSVTILSAIGDSAMIVPTHEDSLRPWLWQMYRILNLLRKVTVKATSTTEYKAAPYDTYATWGDLLAAYNAATWGGTHHPDDAGFEIDFTPGGSGIIYGNRFNSLFLDNQGLNPGVDLFEIDFNDIMASLDLYLYPWPHPSPLFPWDDRYGFADDVKAPISIFSEQCFNPRYSLAPAGWTWNLPEPPLEPPAGNATYTYMSNLRPYGYDMGVFSFDGPNGFKFKNW